MIQTSAAFQSLKREYSDLKTAVPKDYHFHISVRGKDENNSKTQIVYLSSGNCSAWVCGITSF